MTLADGKVTTVEKVGSFLLPEESSAWLAYYKGVGGAGAAAADAGALWADAAVPAAGAAEHHRRARAGAGRRRRPSGPRDRADHARSARTRAPT